MSGRDRGKSAEIELLLLCARRTLGVAESGRLAELVRNSLDWPLLLSLADENGLLPLLQHHLLLEVGPTKIPPEVLSELQARGRQNALRALFLTAELFRVLDEFHRRQIVALPYKGPVLAARAYGSPSLRQFDDLDIVAPQKSMPFVHEAMASLGYQARLPRERFLATARRAVPGEYVFVHQVNGAMIEIHTELTLRHFPVPPDLEGMFFRSITVSVDGREVPAFAAEDLLLMLAVHGAKDFWARMVWVADVAEIVKQSANLDWESLLVAASKLKVTRMLNLGLSLAREIAGLALVPEIASRIQADAVVKRLTRQLGGCLLNGEALPDGVFSRSLYRISMTEGLLDGLRYWVRLTTAPAEEDWAMAELSTRLSKSYSVLRPIRLWKKYGQRTPRK
ncbi:MAG: nucleotidyltransferase domain-containing protein [Candidatus Acidiferrales bacterium]